MNDNITQKETRFIEIENMTQQPGFYSNPAQAAVLL